MAEKAIQNGGYRPCCIGHINILKLVRLMAYIHDMWVFEGSIEHEYKYKGKYGAKGEKRAPKKKATPEQIRRQNQKNKEKKMRRLIKANFKEHDIWTTCKYQMGDRPELTEVKKDFKAFRNNLTAAYRKRGKELKYIYRMEVGSRGGIHIHILVNRIEGGDTEILLDQMWDRVLKNSFKRRQRTEQRTAGLIDTRSTYSSGGYEQLANYLCKMPKEDSKEYEQLSLFDEKDKKELLMVQTSRNLIRPEPVRKEYSHWTMRKIMDSGPVAKEGYYIEKNSWKHGVNPYNGWSYAKYTEVKCTSTSTRTAKLRI